MPKFHKTTVTEMYQYLGQQDWEGSPHIPSDFKGSVCECQVNFAEPGGGGSPIPGPHIHTQHGGVLIRKGEWVAKDAAGYFYPVAADVLAASYEEVK